MLKPWVRWSLLVPICEACQPTPNNPPPSPVSAATSSPVVRTFVFRRFSTGKIVSRSKVWIWTLRVEGDDVRMSKRELSGPGHESLTESAGPESWSGHAKQERSGLTLELSNSEERLTLSCKKATIAVASHDAVRVRDENFDGECGNRGRWAPQAVHDVEALRCRYADDTLAFVDAPGVEELEVNDDCVMQGRGFRAIAEDGAIARPVLLLRR
jgi:hypothetical protein